jgi:ATP-dependent helicase HepA
VTDAAPWKAGDHLTHRFNPELGVGRVTAVDGRALVVHFPDARTTLRMAANSDALVPIQPGSGIGKSGFDRSKASLAPVDAEIRRGIDRLRSIRQSGIGSFLGGRVRLFPHQLYVAERACAADPVRWLLADEVGLGKTIEACLILNRLVHTRQIERCVVVVPEALTVQWLGELWRKYHQVFTLLDGPRLADVARDFGADFNPFDVHRRVVVALETLIARPGLTEQAVSAGIDLLVVDEAQRIRRPRGHPGDAGWRAIAPIAALGRHVLLLSATPLEDDAHGFFRLLQLLRPEEFPDDMSFESRLAHATPLPPCTSSTRRTDIGGLPPRVGIPIDLPAALQHPGPFGSAGLEDTARAMPAADPIARRKKLERIRRALLSDAALEWLVANAARWRDAKEKSLVFVAQRETLEMLRTALSHRVQLATAIFHEELSAAQRDTQVARFREPAGPSLMISTEAGGEGRNFEFCRRLVLFDLPWKPTVVEQRIGRLDRIGRRMAVEIVYFRPPGGIGADVVRLFETLGVFREPLAGLEPQLAHVERALEEIALTPEASLTDERLGQIVADARAARTRIREAAYQQLHRDPYRPEMATGILARVPGDLDELTERAITAACGRLGFRVEHLRGRRIFAIELGNEAVVDSLPGVPGGSSYVGTFDREEAVEDESIDFFASGHPLVEGVLAHFEDNAGSPPRKER